MKRIKFKNYLMVLVIVVFSFFSPVFAVKDSLGENDEWQKYENKDYNFQFEYPENWEYSEKEINGEVFINLYFEA